MKLYVIILLASATVLSSGVPGFQRVRMFREPNWDKIYDTCYKLLRTSPEARKIHSRITLNDNPELMCLTRCTGIFTGFYDDETGVNMDKMQAKYWMVKDFPMVKEKYIDCVKNIEPYGNDYCRKSYLVDQCFFEKALP